MSPSSVAMRVMVALEDIEPHPRFGVTTPMVCKAAQVGLGTATLALLELAGLGLVEWHRPGPPVPLHRCTCWHPLELHAEGEGDEPCRVPRCGCTAADLVGQPLSRRYWRPAT